MSRGEQRGHGDDQSRGISEAAIVLPALVTIFFVFGTLYTIAFYVTRRKCCQKRLDYPEEERLKICLQLEKEKIIKAIMKLSERTHAIFGCILQQEDIDASDEVKESYKTLLTDSSSPCLCYPNAATCLSYTPSKAVIQERNSNPVLLDPVADVSDDSWQHSASPPGVRHKMAFPPPDLLKSTDILRGGDGGSIKIENTSISSSDMISNSPRSMLTKKTLLERDLQQSDNVKDILFSKWLNNLHMTQTSATEDDYRTRFSSNAATNTHLLGDAVDPILTSISRMDAKRRQTFYRTSLYKQVMSGIISTSLSKVDDCVAPGGRGRAASGSSSCAEEELKFETTGRHSVRRTNGYSSESYLNYVPSHLRTCHNLSEEIPEHIPEKVILDESPLTTPGSQQRIIFGEFRGTDPSHSRMTVNKSPANEPSIHVRPTRLSLLPLVSKAPECYRNNLCRRNRKNVRFAASISSSIQSIGSSKKDGDVTGNTSGMVASTFRSEMPQNASCAGSLHSEAAQRDEPNLSSPQKTVSRDISNSIYSVLSTRNVARIHLDLGGYSPRKSWPSDHRDGQTLCQQVTPVKYLDELSLSSDALYTSSKTYSSSGIQSLRRQNSEPLSLLADLRKTANILQWIPHHHLTKIDK